MEPEIFLFEKLFTLETPITRKKTKTKNKLKTKTKGEK